MRENEQAKSYTSTTVRGIYHELNVVLAGTQFFWSYLAPQAWQLRGIHGMSKYAQIRVKARVR